jgi:hypothetical protein
MIFELLGFITILDALVLLEEVQLGRYNHPDRILIRLL